MMRFALGARWGWSRMPLKALGAEGDAAAPASWLSSVVRAAPPRPSAKRPKNSRREKATLMLLQKFGMGRVVRGADPTSSFRHRRIMVQDCLGNNGPRG